MSERRRNMPRFASAAKHLTRYTPDQARPASTSQLTRFTQEHARDDVEEPAHRAVHLQQANTVTAPRPAPPAQQPVQQPVQQALPKTEVVQPAEPQVLRSTQADLYSDAPITISVLKRALPRRFAEVEAGKTVGFNAPAKQSAQFGLTHAIRPLKSLFPYDPT